jgi:hypothetical protein
MQMRQSDPSISAVDGPGKKPHHPSAPPAPVAGGCFRTSHRGSVTAIQTIQKLAGNAAVASSLGQVSGRARRVDASLQRQPAPVAEPVPAEVPVEAETFRGVEPANDNAVEQRPTGTGTGQMAPETFRAVRGIGPAPLDPQLYRIWLEARRRRLSATIGERWRAVHSSPRVYVDSFHEGGTPASGFLGEEEHVLTMMSSGMTYSVPRQPFYLLSAMISELEYTYGHVTTIDALDDAFRTWLAAPLVVGVRTFAVPEDLGTRGLLVVSDDSPGSPARRRTAITDWLRRRRSGPGPHPMGPPSRPPVIPIPGHPASQPTTTTDPTPLLGHAAAGPPRRTGPLASADRRPSTAVLQDLRRSQQCRRWDLGLHRQWVSETLLRNLDTQVRLWLAGRAVPGSRDIRSRRRHREQFRQAIGRQTMAARLVVVDAANCERAVAQAFKGVSEPRHAEHLALHPMLDDWAARADTLPLRTGATLFAVVNSPPCFTPRHKCNEMLTTWVDDHLISGRWYFRRADLDRSALVNRAQPIYDRLMLTQFGLRALTSP